MAQVNQRIKTLNCKNAAIALHILIYSPVILAFEIEKQAMEHYLSVQTIEEMVEETVEIIEVNGRRNQAFTEATVETQKLLSIAGLADDPLSAVYSLPGVVYAGGDDGGEPAIRGSSPNDNAFYIDDMPVGYIFHLFGDSIFNKNLVRDFSLHPAAFGSQFGNATGGVFDVQLRDPRNQDTKVTLDASLIKTGILVESGINDDQAFYFSYRRSNVHLFIDEDEEDEGLTVFKAPISDDYQGKYHWLIGNEHKLTFTITGASDTGGINISKASEEGRIDPDLIGDLSLKERFDSQGLSYQYFGDSGKIMQIVLGHTNEISKQSFGAGQFIQVDEQVLNLRADYQVNWFPAHTLAIGTQIEKSAVDYQFDAIPYYCTDHDADCESRKGERLQDTDKLTSHNYAIYATDSWILTPEWQLDFGFRAERNDYTEQSFIHPRATLSWLASDYLTIHAKSGTYSRFPDIETVLRKIGNPQLSSPKAVHHALRFEYQLDDIWSSSLDFYYKDLEDLPRSLNEDDSNAHRHFSNDMSGSAYGVEWVIEKSLADNWYGWASISWSQSNRTDELTNKTTQYYLDTPFLANFVANYHWNEKWDFGARLTLRSGQKYTPIIGLRDNPDHTGYFLPIYGELNSKTLPTYHRLDLEANYHSTLWGKEAKWTFALLNALNAKNISGYYYAPDGQETKEHFSIDGEEGLGMFPSIGLTVAF